MTYKNIALRALFFAIIANYLHFVTCSSHGKVKEYVSGEKMPRLRRLAASVAGLQTPSKPAANPRMRKSGADLLTPSRWRVVTACCQVSKGKDRLPRSGMQELRRRFPSYN